jgi:hypothetical protein
MRKIEPEGIKILKRAMEKCDHLINLILSSVPPEMQWLPGSDPKLQQKPKLRAFFPSCQPFVLDALPNIQKYNQDHLVQKVIPELRSERPPFACRKTLPEFATRLDISMCCNDTKMTKALDKANVMVAPQLVHSPDPSPCAFCLFEMLKCRMTDKGRRSRKKFLIS